MAAGAITIGAGAVVTGNALSIGGTVTLSANTITTPPTVTITGGRTAFTADTAPTIAGTAEAATGTTIVVTMAGQRMTTTIGADGTWRVTATTVPDGWYLVVASIMGPAGNSGTARQTLTVGPTSTVPLGSAASYSVLGATGVTNSGATDVSGDLGVSPAGSIVGFPPGVVGGHIHAGDPQAAQAQGDLLLAYTDAAARAPQAGFAGDLNGLTFSPGIYDTAAALALTGALTLDGQGDPNAVFIFQVDAALNTAAASTVSLTGGARASNVFWQVNGAAGIGAAASFSGTIMAAGAITIGAGAVVTGNALSIGGTVTLSANTITTSGAFGALSIVVASDAINLGTYAVPVTGRTIAGLLGSVQVVDTRGGSSLAGWVVTVAATAFTSPSGASLAPSSISYSAGPINQIRGAVTITADDPNGLTSAAAAVTATGISGDNDAQTTWNPTISVTVPGGLPTGRYTSTITQTIV
jgi:hypothetical protein